MVEALLYTRIKDISDIRRKCKHFFPPAFLIPLAVNWRNCITANIKLPKASVPRELVDALTNAFFQGGSAGVDDDALVRWKYQSAVIDDNANLPQR